MKVKILVRGCDDGTEVITDMNIFQFNFLKKIAALICSKVKKHSCMPDMIVEKIVEKKS